MREQISNLQNSRSGKSIKSCRNCQYYWQNIRNGTRHCVIPKCDFKPAIYFFRQATKWGEV